MALFSSKRRTATATALEPVEALKVPAERFREFLLANPAIAVSVLEQVVERLREVQDRVEAWWS
jgi:CRP-like cAMP-binding protein